jgi:Protein of unknown function (DUF1501)
MKARTGFCDGQTRRDFLMVGSLGFLGLSLDQFFRLQSAQAQQGLYSKSQELPQRAKSCILIWLTGGPSHIDTFDLKPDASDQVRGEFKPIDTAVPGIQICEHLPKIASTLDRVSVIRTMTGPEGEHDRAAQHLLTGHRPLPATTYPSYGSVATFERGLGTWLPNYICIPNADRAMGAGYLSKAYDPFAVGGDPASPTFQVRDLYTSGYSLSFDRINRRRDLVKQVDDLARSISRNEATTARDAFFAQAYDLVTSRQARDAFEIGKEDQPVREKYGPTSLGQGCLLARRLVEAGVAFITVNSMGLGGQMPATWDTHQNNFPTLKDQLLPQLDNAVSALVQDLDERGLLDSTLVVVMGEFGRTPKINKMAGRDHWPRANSILVAGGGIKRGTVVGKTDAQAEYPVDRPVSPADLAATMFTLLGIDPNKAEHTNDGRSIKLVADGEAVQELMS